MHNSLKNTLPSPAIKGWSSVYNTNRWPLAVHIYHIMIIVTSGFSRNIFLLSFSEAALRKFSSKRGVTLKHGVTKWGTPLVYLLMYPYILMSYFIYSVVKAMEPGSSSVKKLDRGKTSFLRYWHLKFTPKKPNSYIIISVSELSGAM